jgi:hypothetical protein
MVAVAKSAAPFFEGVHTYYGAAFVVAVITIAKLTGFTRWVKKKWRNYRNWILIRDGKAAIPNVSKEILSIPVRLKNLDDGQLKILDEIASYKESHNAEVGAISTKVDQVLESNAALTDQVGKLFKNGLNTNNPGDTMYRIAEKLGVVVPEPIAQDRRSTDPKEKP